jgi:hypothetical protein
MSKTQTYPGDLTDESHARIPVLFELTKQAQEPQHRLLKHMARTHSGRSGERTAWIQSGDLSLCHLNSYIFLSFLAEAAPVNLILTFS